MFRTFNQSRIVHQKESLNFSTESSPAEVSNVAWYYTSNSACTVNKATMVYDLDSKQDMRTSTQNE
ncbi:hypothetical protein HF325_004878 [Metschnikowia pulcherrima]|uniref:Uncharacterized protein n=1 Tax=Metschnikowia pulcherrima TaxID=27326 RepID=A0A8H7GP82_9ASCO|nr:hypothetical protein HF325_004878 [Metschnikowia pulcherrima]